MKIHLGSPSQLQYDWCKACHYTNGNLTQASAELWRQISRTNYLSKTCWQPSISILYETWHSICSQSALPVHAQTNKWSLASRKKRVLRYLAGTTTHGIFFSADNSLVIHAFSDADWAGDSDDYVSTNAYIIYLGRNPISWRAKKQKSVSRSSTEAEYRSVANTASEIRWICNFLTKLGITLPAPPVIYCDNVGATFLCSNPIFHTRMKHVALDYHFICGQIQNRLLCVSHVHTKDQLTDTLTKPLPRQRFLELRDKIGVL